MIKFYDFDENNVKEVKDCNLAKWINVYSPSNKDFSYLLKNLNIDEDIIHYCLDEDEISRVITNKESKVILIDVPLVSNKKDGFLTTGSLGIIFDKKRIVTICSKEYMGFQDFVSNNLKVSSNTTSFVLDLIERIIVSYLHNLKVLNNQANKIERTLKKSTQNKEMFKLMNIQKSLVYLRTSLISNNRVLEIISNDNYIIDNEEHLQSIKNNIIENKQAIETASIYSEILNGMLEAFAAIINNNLNSIMKFLAGITIVFSIPTMIASFMGMNVNLGRLGESADAAFYILLISFLLSGLVAYILKKKNML